MISLHTVCSIWPIERTQSSATTLGLSEPGSNGNKAVQHIPQISKSGASPTDCLLSYPGDSLAGEGLIPLQGFSQSILLPYPTEPATFEDLSI